jgi:hypothetical protein
MAVENEHIRQRLQRVIQESRIGAQERRARAEVASVEGEQLLRDVLAPMFRKMAHVLKAEGHLFRVSTPKEAVQLIAEGPGENRIELAIDTTVDPPVLQSRVVRTRGRRVLVDEGVVRTGDAIASMTDEDTLDFLLSAIPPFVEK